MNAGPYDDFFEEFRRVVHASGRRAGWSPFKYVDAWRALVREVSAGYGGDYDDYWDDLSVRDQLELALTSPSLDAWPAWRQLRSEIQKADDDLREAVAAGPLVRPDLPWWAARLPPRAGGDFAEEAESVFGVELTVIDD